VGAVTAADWAPGTVAALYVDPKGVYSTFGDVELWDGSDVTLWDDSRDARKYAGPWPVVAHPPCGRWCQYAGLVEARWGHRKGDDGGSFAAALAAVRRWGGVLEHPAYSAAWAAHGLARPARGGGWTTADSRGGWTCHVEQGRYGHPARKATWLYACGVELAALRWGPDPDGAAKALVGWAGNRVFAGSDRPRIGKAVASATPAAFATELIGIARSAVRAAA
jgi:hypothetical protein